MDIVESKEDIEGYIDEKIEQEVEDDLRAELHEWKEREQRKKHLYCKLISIQSRENRLELEKELLEVLLK
jgi:hypothetical protein